MKNITLAFLLALTTLTACGAQLVDSTPRSSGSTGSINGGQSCYSTGVCSSLTTHVPASAPPR